jgi:hypothetical protein
MTKFIPLGCISASQLFFDVKHSILNVHAPIAYITPVEPNTHNRIAQNAICCVIANLPQVYSYPGTNMKIKQE